MHALSVTAYRVGQCVSEMFSVEERFLWQHIREVRVMEGKKLL